jgi:hypothetical protein
MHPSGVETGINCRLFDANDPNGPELPGSGRSDWIINHIGAQWKTGHNRYRPERRVHNPLVAGTGVRKSVSCSFAVQSTAVAAMKVWSHWPLSPGGDCGERWSRRLSRPHRSPPRSTLASSLAHSQGSPGSWSIFSCRAVVSIQLPSTPSTPRVGVEVDP